MGENIERLAEFVAQTRWDDVPAPVQRHTKLVLLDTLGVILAGAERPEVRQLRERLAGTAGTGATVYARGWPSYDPRTAALLNGIAGRSIELCEGLRLVSGQAAMQVLPGSWRSASTRGAPAASCWRHSCSVTMSPGDLPAGSPRGPWRIRMDKCRCWRRPSQVRACVASTRPVSAAPCASPRSCC